MMDAFLNLKMKSNVRIAIKQYQHAHCNGWQNTPASQHNRTKAGCNAEVVVRNLF